MQFVSGLLPVSPKSTAEHQWYSEEWEGNAPEVDVVAHEEGIPDGEASLGGGSEDEVEQDH